MIPWTRHDTRLWIDQVENRIDDMHYYLCRTVEWCERNGIYDDKDVFVCNFLTCIWVSHMRGEQISYKELLDLLGLEELDYGEDKIYNLGPKFKDLDHEEMLNLLGQDKYGG